MSQTSPSSQSASFGVLTTRSASSSQMSAVHAMPSSGFTGVPAWQSRDAVRYAIKAVQGEELPKYIEIPVDPIGPDEIKDYVQMDESDFWWVGDDQMPEEFLPEL